VKVTTEKPEPGVAALTVEVAPEEFDRALDQAWRRVANRVDIPGFRRGRAPRALVERHVGAAAIEQEALRRLLPERYDAAVDEAGIEPIDQPSFDLVQVERGKPLIFKATVAVRPTVELGDYTTLAIEPERVEVSKEEVERVLDRLRESQAEWVPVEDRGLELGDMAIADVTIGLPPAREGGAPRTSRRENAEIILGEHGFPQGFDQQVLGMRPGETRTFELTWGAPAARGEGEAPEAESGEGEPPPERTLRSTFTVKLKEIKRKQLPPLDDAFARSLGEHETLVELREDVRRRLRDEAARAARVATENKAVDAAVARATFEIPERLIELETEAQIDEQRRSLARQGLTLERYLQALGRSMEDFRREQREVALQQLKARLVLDRLAEEEGLTVEPAEVDAEIERLAQQYGEQAGELRRLLSSEDSRRRIATSLRRRKAIERLVHYAGGYPAGTAPEPETAPSPGSEAAPPASERPPAPGTAETASAEAVPAATAPETGGG